MEYIELTAYIFIAFILLVGFLIYVSYRIAETHGNHEPSKGQKVACISIFTAEVIWFAVFLFGIWHTLGLPEIGFYIVSSIVIVPSIVFPIFLFLKRKTFFIATLNLILGILFSLLFGLLRLTPAW